MGPNLKFGKSFKFHFGVSWWQSHHSFPSADIVPVVSRIQQKARPEVNLTRIQNSPETYVITESRNVRASKRWQSSGTRSGECVSIFPDGTRIPFTPTRSRKSTPRTIRISDRAAELAERNRAAREHMREMVKHMTEGTDWDGKARLRGSREMRLPRNPHYPTNLITANVQGGE